jgi:hypothetical protein
LLFNDNRVVDLVKPVLPQVRVSLGALELADSRNFDVSKLAGHSARLILQ